MASAPIAQPCFYILRRDLAYEASDSGLLSPELAAGIRRVKGARRLGVRLGNWLTAEQARTLCQLPNADPVKGKQDRAIPSILLGGGLRRRELAELTLDHLQQREDHWAVVDLMGKRVICELSLFQTGSSKSPMNGSWRLGSEFGTWQPHVPRLDHSTRLAGLF
jgi:integrase